MREKIEIRRMTIDDVDGVMEVDRLSFRIPWSRESFESEVNGKNPAVYFVADYEGRICGYMGVWHIVDEGHITNVAVHPEFRQKGIGDMLVKRTLADGAAKGINAFTLEVRASNEAAQKLYENNGFSSAGIRKRYYEDNNEDAVIMWSEIQR